MSSAPTQVFSSVMKKVVYIILDTNNISCGQGHRQVLFYSVAYLIRKIFHVFERSSEKKVLNLPKSNPNMSKLDHLDPTLPSWASTSMTHNN